jgi:hypothetical protein
MGKHCGMACTWNCEIQQLFLPPNKSNARIFKVFSLKIFAIWSPMPRNLDAHDWLIRVK